MDKSQKLSLAVVILAAGGASRFGSVKQLAIHKSKTLLQQKIDTCCQLSHYDIYVVLGAAYQQILMATKFRTSQIIQNTNWLSGMSSSINISIDKLAHQYDAIMFLAADQILIDHKHLERLIKQWHDKPTNLIAAKFDNEITIPAIFPRSYYDELLMLRGDKGGKKILMAHQDNLVLVDIPQAKFDIDFQEDLQNLN